MKEFIDVLDPTAKTTIKQEQMATGLNDLNGKVIGLVDNRNSSLDLFKATATPSAPPAEPRIAAMASNSIRRSL